MNLKEIGVLLVGIYLITSLLMAYKYYVAKGSVYKVSRFIVFRYLLRFVLLSAFMLLTFYSLQVKQTYSNSIQNKQEYLFGIAKDASSLTWNQLQSKVKDLSENSTFGLILYDNKEKRWMQVIPQTDQDSFLNLIEQHAISSTQFPHHVYTEFNTPIINNEAILHFQKVKNTWEKSENLKENNSIFNTNELNNWITGSYLKIYLVILIVLLLFIDSVFTAKAIKI
ncbi:MAG: hypothetical protein RL360_1490 [Bacteroidota bacterium]|jgi:hypothetical protein